MRAGARTRYCRTGCLILVMISVLVYSRAFDNGFRQDDHAYLKLVETTSLLESLRPSPGIAFYRPGALILFRLEHLVFGRSSGAYIAFNFLVHLVSSFLMLLVLRRICLFRGCEATAAGLFLLGLGHYGKAVMWACCSGQLVSITLSLAGMLFSLRWAGCMSAANQPRGGRGRGYNLLLAISCMTAAVLFHEGAIVTPAVAAFAVLACRRSGSLGGRGKGALLLFLLPMTLSLFMCRGISSVYPAYVIGTDSLRRVPVFLIRYAGFAVVPLQRTGMIAASSPLQGLIAHAPQLHLAAGAILIAALGFLAVLNGKGERILSIWFPAAILPFTLVALPEGWLQLRYLYHASIPLCGLAAAGFHRLLARRGPLSRTVSMVLLLLAVICTATLVLLLERQYAGLSGP